MARHALIIAYDGTHFHGWQKQEPPDAEPLRTVAGVMEERLTRLLGEPINLVGASRTDAGVHAHGQTAHFDAVLRVPIERLPDAINSRLPDDVVVRHAAHVPDDFDAIKHAVRKQYRYRIHNATQRPLESRHYVSHCWAKLDPTPMQDAAQRLVGTHDFEGFAAAGHGRTSTVRTIFDCHIETHGDEVHILVEGDGFLYNMVRIIAGTLMEVGRGRFTADVIDRVLASTDRSDAGPTMPPTGLVLEWIHYDALAIDDWRRSINTRDFGSG